MPIARFLKIVNILLVSVLALALCSVWLLNKRARENQEQAERTRAFIELTHELKISSHLLTKFVRLYVVTGNPTHEQEFLHVARQRNGEQPRPHNAAVAPGMSVPLIQLLRETAPSPEDFRLVEEAHALSQKLVDLENAAINAVRQMQLKNDGGRLSGPDWERAVDMVFGVEYVAWQQKILEPLLSLLGTARQRAEASIVEQADTAILGSSIELALLILMLGTVLPLLWYSRTYILQPLRRITAFSRGIGQGKLHQRLDEKAHNEIGQLATTLNIMLDRLEDEMAKSTTDPLTTLHNRRYFDNRVKEFRTDHDRDGQPFSLLGLDIDFFKSVNDTWGHTYGDEVLRDFAAILKGCCREGDVLARMGGEEFSILIRGNAGNAWTLAERIRQNVENTLRLPNGKPVTCSVGVAQYQPGQDISILQGNADDALYRAKHSGRNRVCIFDDTPEGQGMPRQITASHNSQGKLQ